MNTNRVSSAVNYQALTSKHKGTCRVVYDAKQGPVPNLCMNCKFYQATNLVDAPANMSKCTRFGVISVVDGAVEYEYVGYIREYVCQGEYYEQR